MMIYAIHRPDAGRLETVKAEMIELGAPTIRVVFDGDKYIALEGSHRLAAAHQLGIMPMLEVLEQDEEIDIWDFDWASAAGSGTYDHISTAGEAAGGLFDIRDAVAYRFGAE